jgi:hypothetical protein
MSDTITAPRTLAERTYEALRGEDSPWQEFIGATELHPEAISDQRGEHASDIDTGHFLTWAFLYGAAYTMARVEEPLISDMQAREVAREAADTASRWHMTVGGRPEGEC